MKKFLGLMALALLVSGNTAHASVHSEGAENRNGFYFEPGAVYEFQGNGRLNGNFGQNGSLLSGDETGPGATLRLGAHIHNIFFAGVEGLYLHDQQDTQFGSYKGNEYGGGLFAGVQMPWVIGLRAWGGYLPYVQTDFAKTAGYQPHFTDGRGWKVGAGMRFSIVSINVEYMQLDFHKSTITNDQGSQVASTGDISHKQDAWMVGVSFPLAL